MDFLLETLKDKSKLISFLLEVIQTSDRDSAGLSGLSDSLTREEPNLSQANIAKCLAVTMKVTAKQTHQIKQLAIICLIMCQSSGFDSDIAHMMAKMGRGGDALKQMFKNKLDGK